MSNRPPASVQKAKSLLQQLPATTTAPVGQKRLDSEVLMDGQRVLEIAHLGKI